MNNALNAKLSKLVYSPVPGSADFLIQAQTFDRLLLLIRQLYHMIDTHEDINQIILRIQYGKRHGLIMLDAKPPQTDGSTLRLKRWLVYSRIAERVIDSGDDVSVALDEVSGQNTENHADKINQLIIRFRLYGSVTLPRKKAIVAEQTEAAPSQTKPITQSIISLRGRSLSRINTKAKTERYGSAQTSSMKISRLSFNGYKSK